MNDARRMGGGPDAAIRVARTTFGLGIVMASATVAVAVINGRSASALAALFVGLVVGVAVVRRRYRNWDAFVDAWGGQRSSGTPGTSASWIPWWLGLEVGGSIIGAGLATLGDGAERVVGCVLVGVAAGFVVGLASRYRRTIATP